MKRMKLPAALSLAVFAVAALAVSASGYFDPKPHEHVLPYGKIDLEKTFMDKYNALTPVEKEKFDREVDRIRAEMLRNDSSNPRPLEVVK